MPDGYCPWSFLFWLLAAKRRIASHLPPPPPTRSSLSPSTQSLQDAFEREYREVSFRSSQMSADTSFYFSGLSPQWEHADHGYSALKKRFFLEVPIQADEALLFGIPGQDQSQVEDLGLANITYLASEESYDGSQVLNYFKSFIPSKKSIDENRSFEHSPGHVPVAYDGTVLYHSLSGEFLGGFVYEDGNPSQLLSKAKVVDHPSDSMSIVRQSQKGSYSYEICTPIWKTFKYTTYESSPPIGPTESGDFFVINQTHTVLLGFDCKTMVVTYTDHCEIDYGPGGSGAIEPDEEEDPIPCMSEDKKRVNPLMYMALAPTTGDRYASGRFGSARGRPHNGIDLHAPVGTPIYAMMDGVVSKVVDSQPDRSESYGTKNNLPKEYNDTGKDRDDAGNRIYIKSTFDGESIEQLYWHLRAGSPIGTNPATKKPYKVGDKVSKGDVIGYSGITGNAWNVENPHLHLGIKKNGTYVNPEKYLVATVKNQEKIVTPCDQ